MVDGHAHWTEVTGLRGIYHYFCDIRLLCCVDRLHPLGHGGTLSFSARTPSALVSMRGSKEKGCRDF